MNTNLGFTGCSSEMTGKAGGLRESGEKRRFASAVVIAILELPDCVRE